MLPGRIADRQSGSISTVVVFQLHPKFLLPVFATLASYAPARQVGTGTVRHGTFGAPIGEEGERKQRQGRLGRGGGVRPAPAGCSAALSHQTYLASFLFLFYSTCLEVYSGLLPGTWSFVLSFGSLLLHALLPLSAKPALFLALTPFSPSSRRRPNLAIVASH